MPLSEALPKKHRQDMSAREQLALILRCMLDALLPLLILLRPLTFGGELGSHDHLAWFLLVGLGWLAVAGECLLGLRSGLRWGPATLLVLPLLLLLLPAAAASPLPSEGWGWWAGWAGIVAAAGFVLQALPGRERLAIGAFLAALVLTAVLGLVQAGQVLPHLASDPAVLRAAEGLGLDAATLEERSSRGGAYATFTISNLFAQWLVGCGLLALGMLLVARRELLRRGGDVRAPALLALACGVAILALTQTNAKGAVAVALAAGAAAWSGARRGPLRWLPLALLALVATAVLLWPPATRLAGDSATVRIGYWRAAASMIVERPLSGHGHAAFALESPARLRVEDEFSRHPHNDLLSAAVAAGLPAGLLLTGLLAVLALRAPGVLPWPATERWPALVPIAAVPYLALFGLMVSDNLHYWPWLPAPLWAMALGLLAALCIAASRRLPAPPSWALQAAVAAMVAGCMIDFVCHDLGAIGSLALLAALAGHGRAKTFVLAGNSRLLTLLPGLALILGLALIWPRAAQRGEAWRTLHLFQGMAMATQRGDETAIAGHLHDLALTIGRPPPSQGQEAVAVRRDAWAAAYEEALRWPADLRLAPRLAAQHGDPRESSSMLAILAERLPQSTEIHSLRAQAEAASGRLDAAIDAQRQAVALSPWILPHRQMLARLLDARGRSGDREEATAIRAQVRELDAQVFPRHRSRPEDGPRPHPELRPLP